MKKNLNFQKKKIISAEADEKKQNDTNTAEKFTLCQKKRVSTGIELQGFIVSSMGITANWKIGSSKSRATGIKPTKINRHTIAQKSTKTPVCKQRQDLKRNPLRCQAVVLPLRQMVD